MNINDSQVIETFEQKVAEYAGSKYGVAVSSQTNAVFLCLELLKLQGHIKEGDKIEVPKQTYMSVPMTILNVGCTPKFIDDKWSGAYQLKPTNVWDSAVRFTRDMYVKDSLYCVSFQYKKALPIGRGGMILTDSKHEKDLLDMLRFNGRTNGISQANDYYKVRGWNMYITPEQASRGLTLLTLVPDKNKDIASWQDYPNVARQFDACLFK